MIRNSRLFQVFLLISVIFVAFQLPANWGSGFSTSAATDNALSQAGYSGSPWQMYGHDNSHTFRSSAIGPTYAQIKWSYNFSVVVQDNASPVIGSDGTIYMPSENGFFAVNPDGTLKWEKINLQTRMAPAVASDNSAVYVYDTPSGLVYALNPANSSTLWSYYIGYSTYGSPTIGSDNTIYIAGEPDRNLGPSYMYALNPNGTLKWRWTTGNDFWIESSPVIGPNGEVIFYHNELGVVALNATGGFMWNIGGSGPLGAAWNSPSLGADGTIYIGSSDYFFYALNSNGTIKWKAPVEHWMDKAACAISSDNSTIYRGDDGGVFYAFDKSGALKWKYDTGINGVIESTPALSANGVIYFTEDWTTAANPSDRGFLYALRCSDGKLLWKYEIGWSSSSPAIGADGTLYAVGKDASRRGTLYAFSSTPSMDVTPPVMVVISPENKTYATSSVPLLFEVDETIVYSSYSLDGHANVTVAGDVILAGLSDGPHNIVVYANDTVGNVGSSSKVLFAVDTAPPTPTPSPTLAPTANPTASPTNTPHTTTPTPSPTIHATATPPIPEYTSLLAILMLIIALPLILAFAKGISKVTVHVEKSHVTRQAETRDFAGVLTLKTLCTVTHDMFNLERRKPIELD
jgi:outer membrane protein assembly factor BamB